MGKDSEVKEDSGFGFKDKNKALDTLKLLEKEPHSYQGLTVRGLLGRAKRTLKLTKDPEKLKNIAEAIAVFEKWVEDNKKPSGSDNKKKSSDKKESSDEDDHSKKEKKERSGSKDKDKDENSSDTVPGLGFKDKEKALETIKLLNGRDPDYQKLAVKGLIGRAKRVITCTKDKDKLQNIKDAMDVFEKFLEDFDKMNMSKQNMSYLPLSVIDNCLGLAKHYNISCERSTAFIKAYRSADGQYKKLRTLEDSVTKKTWDIVRNEELKLLLKKLDDPDLFEDNDNPTKEHVQMILWAYSPQEQRTKKLKIVLPDEDVDMEDEKLSNNGKSNPDKESKDRKRKSSPSDESSTKKKK